MSIVTRFVNAWTSTVLRKEADGRSTGLTQCLWGDWVGVKDQDGVNGWLPVRTRGEDGWLRSADLTPERPLEVNFVDIGQGDGTFIVTPDDRMLIRCRRARQHVPVSSLAIQPAPGKGGTPDRSRGDHASGQGPLQRISTSL